MLAFDHPEQPSAPNYNLLDSSIKETFSAIDRFEWQASDELVVMRDNHRYKAGGYKSFEDYCEKELTKHGGYRRVRDLLAAKRVLDTLPNQLKEKITKPSQTRPLLRLVKTPDKLEEAVAIAVKEKTFPTMSDFAKAAQQVVPTVKRSTKKDKTQRQLRHSVGEKVRVCEKSHPRCGEEGTIESDAPNHWQQIVTFADDEKLLINNSDLDAPSAPFPRERVISPEFAEALAQKDEQHKRELERLELEITARVQAEANARAEAQVQEQLQSIHQLFKQEKERNIQLQQQVDELEKLRGLEFENRRLKQRIQELETRLKEQTEQQWNNTFTLQATKVLNEEVKRSLENMIDLRSLAIEAPKENAQECLRLMGIALGNLASAMNNAQALEAAAIILGSEPTLDAIAYRMEQLQFVPQAVSEIRQVLSQSGCTWWDYLSVAQQYEVIKSDYWAELTDEEKEFIADLEKALIEPAANEFNESFIDENSDFPVMEFSENFIDDLSVTSIDDSFTNTVEPITTFSLTVTEPLTDDSSTDQTQVISVVEETFNDSLTDELTIDQTQVIDNPQEAELPIIGLGSIITHDDPYCALYGAIGEVITDLGDEVWVAWHHWKDRSKKTDRYFKNELRLWVGSNQ